MTICPVLVNILQSGMTNLHWHYRPSLFTSHSFFIGNWQEVLRTHIDPEQLPVVYGGTLTDPDGDPRCRTMVRGKNRLVEQYVRFVLSFWMIMAAMCFAAVADQIRRYSTQVVLCSRLGEGSVREQCDHQPRLDLSTGIWCWSTQQPFEVQNNQQYFFSGPKLCGRELKYIWPSFSVWDTV